MDIVPFVSTEQYTTCTLEGNDLNFSLYPNEVKMVCHYSPCVDLVL